MNSESSSRFKKDAIIALAILIVLLLLWRLVTRPDRFGGFGNVARTGIFGSSGVRLADSRGQGGGATSGPVVGVPGPAGSNSNSGASSATGPPFATTALSGDPVQANNVDKVIAGYDTNDLTPPLNSSPDAVAISQRLSDAGAKGGDIEFSLFWRNYNDLDLHCIDPKGVEIYFSNLKSALSGGELDIDRNASVPFTNAPIENIYWPAGGAPAGVYQVGVFYYAQHDAVDTTRYTVRTVVKDKTNFFTGTIAFAGPQKYRWVCRIQYDPENPDPKNRCRFLPPR